MKCWLATTTICAACLAVASCGSVPALTDPCDVLVDIPAAPPHVNRVLVAEARPTAQGIAQNQLRVEKYRCRE